MIKWIHSKRDTSSQQVWVHVGKEKAIRLSQRSSRELVTEYFI